MIRRLGWIEGPEHEILPASTVSALLDSLTVPDWERPLLQVQINGEPAAGERVIVPGDHVVVFRLPAGGGSRGKRVLGFIAAIGLGLAAPGVGGAIAKGLGWGASATAANIGAGLFMVGSSLVLNLVSQSLIRPPPQPLRSQGGKDADPFFRFSGASNQATPWGAVPRVYGTMRIYPRIVAPPITELRSDSQYLTLLLDCGYGPLDLFSPKIGESPLYDVDPGAQMVVHPRYKAGDPLKLHSAQAVVDAVGVEITSSGIQRTTPIDVERVVVDLFFPQGLGRIEQSSGDLFDNTVQIRAEARKVAEISQWQPLATLANYTTSWPEVDRRITCSVQVDVWQEEGLWWRGFQNPVTSLTVRTQFVPVEGESFRIVINGGGAGEIERNAVVGPSPGTDWQAILDASIPRTEFSLSSSKPATPSFQPANLFSPDYSLLRFGAARREPLAISINLEMLEPGQYDLRFTRESPDDADFTEWSVVQWDKTTTFSEGPADLFRPVVPHTVVELQVKATDQLSGFIDDFSVVATSILPVWNGTGWVEQKTRNPAWIFCDVIMGRANRRPVPQHRIDLDVLSDWAAECDQPDPQNNERALWECNLIVEGVSTVRDVLKTISAAGKAEPALQDGKFSVIREPEGAPVQLITPKNSTDFAVHLNFVHPPHGLKVSFINEEKQFQGDELIVYRDDIAPSQAWQFEDLSLPGVTHASQAYRLARYFLAAGLLRRERVSCSMDFENLVCNRGDLVLVAHDVLKAGGLPRRVVAVKDQQVMLDEPISGAASIRIRGSDDLIEVSEIAPRVIEVPEGTVIDAGDLLEWGATETIRAPFVVEEIQPGPDLSATLRLVEHRPEIQEALGGPIPERVVPDGAGVTIAAATVQNLNLERLSISSTTENWTLRWSRSQSGSASYYAVFEVDSLGFRTLLGRAYATEFSLGPVQLSPSRILTFEVEPVVEGFEPGQPASISASTGG